MQSAQHLAIQDLLSRVIAVYREIDEKYDELDSQLPTIAGDTLTRRLAELDTLMEEAQSIDNSLVEALRKNEDLHPTFVELFAIRKQRIEKLFQNNRDLINRAENNRALLRHELVTMRQNRSALQGYRPPGENGPGLIRTTF